jgi:hypothetical protein
MLGSMDIAPITGFAGAGINLGGFAGIPISIGNPPGIKGTTKLGKKGHILLGGNSRNGTLIGFPASAQDTSLDNYRSQATFHITGEKGAIWLGGNGKDGDLIIFHSKANDINDFNQATIRMNGEASQIDLRNFGALGLLPRSIFLDGSKSNIWLGAAETAGDIGTAGDLVIFPQSVTDTGDLKQATFHLDGSKGTLWLGGRPKGELAGGIDGEIVIFPSTVTDNHDSNQASIAIDGNKGTISVTGDVLCRNADCAEEFDVSKSTTTIDPGTVMVIDHDGKLQESSKAYDKRVAGVVSGAGDCKPGIVLDKNMIPTVRSQ